MASSEEITRHHDTPTDDSVWVHGRPEAVPIRVVEYDAAWPASYALVAARVRAALGERALALETAGFELVIREPAWHEHRALKHHEPDANLHVFGLDCPETDPAPGVPRL